MTYETPTLYQHQQEHKDRTRKALARSGRVILNAPTGCGKTRMAKWILASSALRQPNDRQSGRSMFTVHRRGLVDNAMGSFAEEPALPHGIIMSGCDTDYGARVQVASIDSLISWFIQDGKYPSDVTFDLIIYDEAHSHHPKFYKFLKYHDARREQLGLHSAYVIGLTATPQGEGLSDVYKEIVSGPATQWLIDNKYLSPFRYFRATEGKLGLLVKKGGEFTNESVALAMNGLSGDLVRDWKQFAEGRPTVGFFPRRAHAHEAMEQLLAAGLRVEYVDGETPDSERRSMFRALNNHHIDYLCNVQVIERGTDIPRIGCVQLCVAVGSLVRYRQMIGRGSRCHPDKVDCCVARGTPILTDRGLVPIEDVTMADRVWDGKDWCFHDGPYCNGVREVIQYGGLLLTPDHEVLTNGGWKTAEEASLGAWRPVVGGNGGAPIWTADDSNPHYSWDRSKTGSRGRLCALWKKGVAEVSQNIATYTSWMRALHAEVWPTLPGMGMAKGSASAAALPVPSESVLPSLWPARDRVSVLIDVRGGVLGCIQSRTSTQQIVDDRPHRQQRPLRARESQVGDNANSVAQSQLCMAVAAKAEVPVRDILRQTTFQPSREGDDSQADCGSMAVEVWDIANAGPRNRYCANGLIIANCVLDHGGNIKRHGFFEDDPPWSLDVRTKDAGEVGTRPTIECPQCQAIYRGGKCRVCGYEPTPRERYSQGLVFDGGELKEVQRKAKKPTGIKTPEELMISALYKAGRSRRGMTFMQTAGMFKGMSKSQGTDYYVPKTVTVAGHTYRMVPFGSDDGRRKVSMLYPFTVHGGSHGGKYEVHNSPVIQQGLF